MLYLHLDILYSIAWHYDHHLLHAAELPYPLQHREHQANHQLVVVQHTIGAEEGDIAQIFPVGHSFKLIEQIRRRQRALEKLCHDRQSSLAEYLMLTGTDY